VSEPRPLKPPPPAKNQRGSLVERAYREIKRRIMDNAYPPDSQVLEQDLARQLSMSRTPVREALIRLEKEGLVEIVPRRGMRVLPLSPADMREIYEVIICLEARAAERLAERRPSQTEMQVMIDDVEAMERALTAQDLDAWAAADERFHRHLLTLAGNRRLSEVVGAVADQAHRARMITLRMRPLPLGSNRDHRELIEAVLAGDAARAYRVHHGHRRRAMELLSAILERHSLSRL
jgi:DNA-binding GntR family transcriptional regulator